MKPSASHFHDIRGLRYHVRTWGEPGARPLVLLHGWMDVAASFQFFVDCLRGDWHVIAPDWRGFGLTEWSREGYWFPDYYADLDALLAIYQPDTPVDLVGHSMGGNIAAFYAGIRPHRIARLVNLEGLGLTRTYPDEAPARYARWLDHLDDPPAFKTYAGYGEVAARLKKNNPRLTPERAEFLARHWAQETRDGRVELVSDPRHKRANPYLFRVDEALACWRRITAPVLLVIGRDSHIPGWLKDTPAELAERKASFMNHTEVELDDCGHMIHHDQPERLARLVEDFLAPQA
jgi:pimeloyl-ACP methyl ester carboxylesterase